VAAVQGIVISDEWQEFQAEAEAARAETLQALQTMHGEAQAREAEAERVRLQAAENARIAAELAAQRAALEAQAAELRRQQEQAAAEQRVRDAQAAEEAARIERERLAAEQAAARRDEQRAKTYPSGAPMYSANHIKDNGDLMMLAEDGTRSIFCDVDEDDDPDAHEEPRRPELPDLPPDTITPAILAGTPGCASAVVVAGDDGTPPWANGIGIAAIRALLDHIDAASVDQRFPTQPKMSPAWWSDLRDSAAAVRRLLG